jgi:two-component system, cell cycle response regulator DivK
MTHVLVVEDDPHNAVLFRTILEKRAGFRVTVTEDPAEIVHLVRSGAVQLVVMDVSLRNSRWEGRSVNGVDLCRLLRSDPATAAVPVVLATAHAMRGDAEQLIAESGADDYVAKPLLDHEAFVLQIQRLLAKAA